MAFNKEKVMDSARKYVDKGQIDKAVKEYLRIVHEDPKDVRVWLKIGDLYAKKGAKQEAVETYLKVARFYHDQGFFLKAVAVYKQILKLDPRLVDVILKLAELYRQLGLMSDAMQHFESVAAHFHREGNTKEALATVKKLVDLDPENIATRIKLAELYSKEGLVDDAATEFHVACEQLRRQNRQDDFIKVAERLLWHKPDNHALNRELAGLYLRRNDPRRALQKLQACFKADPRDVETLGLLAQAFQALDQKAKTVSVLKELARVHNENKQRDKAADVFRKILEFVPNDADALAALGTAAAPPPKPVAPPIPTPKPSQSTPMPAMVRNAEQPRFGLTTDMPAVAPMRAAMTGSMPLVDEQSLSGVDFALPEYDDADFPADMEPGPDPRATSAAGERHSDEISKILAETDVYVKYGLHQKAVDHLRRIFNLDPDNVEAHERLKDIFISQGREHEAEQELLKLAELVASGDPDRAETYLQELLQINGTHTGAFELARRFRLRVARMSSHSEHGYGGHGNVATVDPEIDDLDLGRPNYGAPSLGIARHHGNFDDDILGRVAQGSPTPQPPPAPPHGYVPQDFELDLDPAGGDTRQIDANQVPVENDEDDSLIVDAPRRWNEDFHAGPTRFDQRALDAQLDDGALGGDIDRDVASAMGHDGHDSDLPFDPAEARAFDAGVANYADPTAAHDVGAMAYNAGDLDDVDDAHHHTHAHAQPPRAETSLEDDLDEAEFYVGQGMLQEALDVLHTLYARYPNHRLVQVKIREVEAMLGGDGAEHEVPPDSIEQEVPTVGHDAIDLDEIEEMPVDDLEDEPSADARAATKKRGPAVMLQKPIDESDADTHYDLGLAYREMGLHEEAIKAFDKVLRSGAPGREVQCRQMIGMCHRDLGNSSEAIHQFKQGLHDEPSERERQSLYYEIGVTYEIIGDYSEALYYYEMVTKRDPSFADAAMRAATLRERGAAPNDDDI